MASSVNKHDSRVLISQDRVHGRQSKHATANTKIHRAQVSPGVLADSPCFDVYELRSSMRGGIPTALECLRLVETAQRVRPPECRMLNEALLKFMQV